MIDSSDELEAVYGMEDLVGDPLSETGANAEAAIAAMARSTDRMSPSPVPGDSAPLGLSEVVTDRLERLAAPEEPDSDTDSDTDAGPIPPTEEPPSEDTTEEHSSPKDEGSDS